MFTILSLPEPSHEPSTDVGTVKDCHHSLGEAGEITHEMIVECMLCDGESFERVFWVSGDHWYLMRVQTMLISFSLGPDT